MSNKFSFRKGYRARAVFIILNAIFLCIMMIAMLVPIVKVLVDSLELAGNYGIKLWPDHPSLMAYKIIFTQKQLYLPFMISVGTTIVGTFLGLLISTIGAYVLIQVKMPGSRLMSYMLMFTMIFSAGLVPTYLVMKQLHLLNTLAAVVLPFSLNVYNLVLMRNFFEQIPESLFEAAEIDGCTPMGIFWSIVLPLSKPALASIGLFFAVSYWSEYFHYVVYITDPVLFNFQVKLRSLILDDTPIQEAISKGVNSKTIQNAAVIVAILPFAIIYPFCQRYFVTGVTMGAVKE